jgi:hypothetical protein
MRILFLAGAAALLGCPGTLSAQTVGTPPADPTGSNTASANLPPASTPENATFPPANRTPRDSTGEPATRSVETHATVESDTTTPAETGASRATSASQPTASTPKAYPVCSKAIHDECRSPR